MSIEYDISVLMPIYNTKICFLKQCIRSICSQTFEGNIQLVIINDGSNNEVKNYLEQIQSKNNITIKLHHNEDNLGICKSLNIGLELCESELIARMDSDDVMMPNRLQTQYDYFKRRPDTDILGSGIKTFCDEDVMPNIDNNFPLEIDPKWIVKNNIGFFLPHPTVMFKKSCIKELNGYDENMKGYAEDYDLWIRALIKRKKIRIIRQVLVLYRSHNDQLSRKMKPEFQVKIKEIRNKLRRTLGV